MVIYVEIATINASIGILYAIIDAICASMCITTAPDAIKLSTVVIYECPRAYVPSKSMQPSLMCAIKTGAYPSEAPLP